MEKLFTKQTANDATKANAIVITASIIHQVYLVHAFGNFDTATLAVFQSLNGTSDGLVVEAGLSFTVPGIVKIEVPAGTTVWAELSSVGAATDVSLFIEGQGND